ncbi:hypothetical protein L7F22_069400 [Adiantum nelumboides]|nr:hypothetical protein [Adiantum nelumboides]
MEIPTCFKNEYLTDKDFGDVFRALKSLNPTRSEMNMFASYTMMDELLYYLDRICVPQNGALRKILIQEHHEVPFAAHSGINKTYRFLSATYFWPQMQQDVIKYVKACHSCQIMKASRQLPQGLLQPLPVPKERWESISMDFITTLPRTSKGNAQILVIVDRFSKMAHFIPCKKAASAPDIASLFVQHIFRIHGLPRSIISDRDSKFTGHFWTSLFKSLGTNLLFSSAYHPQTDGQTERVNQILEEMLRHYIQNRLASWEEYLPLVEFAYNNAPHSVTGMTPFQAAYGHTPLVPTNFVLQHKVALADQLVQEMQDILIQVRDKLVHVQQKYQKQANKHRQHAEFNEGDMVLLYVASHRYKTVKSVFPKLRPRFYGPFKIIKKNSVVSYKLELPPSWGKLHPTFHISWLKQYIQGDSPVPELSSYVPEIEDEHVILVPEMILDRLQRHFSQYKPIIRELKKTYEAAVRQKALVVLERDKLQEQVSALAQYANSEEGSLSCFGSKSDGTEKDFRQVKLGHNKGSEITRERHSRLDPLSVKFGSASARPQQVHDPPLIKGFTLQKTFKGHAMPISNVAIHPKKAVVVTASDDATWKMWGLPDGDLIMTGDGHKEWVAGLDFHPRGMQLASSSGDCTVKFWSFEKARCVHTFVDHTQAVWSVAYHDSGDVLASASLDHTARIWDLTSPKCRGTLRGHVDSVNCVKWKANSSILCTASSDKTISLWDARTSLCIQTFYGHQASCNHAVLNPKPPTAPVLSPAPWASRPLNLESFNAPKQSKTCKNQQPNSSEIAPVW